jgi:acetyl-CoA synthetase
MITPLPGAWNQKPGSATLPFFGRRVEEVGEQGWFFKARPVSIGLE